MRSTDPQSMELREPAKVKLGCDVTITYVVASTVVLIGDFQLYSNKIYIVVKVYYVCSLVFFCMEMSYKFHKLHLNHSFGFLNKPLNFERNKAIKTCSATVL